MKVGGTEPSLGMVVTDTVRVIATVPSTRTFFELRRLTTGLESLPESLTPVAHGVSFGSVVRETLTKPVQKK